MASTTSNSTLPAAALQASRAALSAALADQEASTSTDAPESTEPGEIQEVEVDMQKQAEQIRTVFSDPNNFNVKVSFSILRTPCHPSSHSIFLPASFVLRLDSLVRLPIHQRSKSSPNTHLRIPPNPPSPNTRRCCCPGMDGRH